MQTLHKVLIRTGPSCCIKTNGGIGYDCQNILKIILVDHAKYEKDNWQRTDSKLDERGFGSQGLFKPPSSVRVSSTPTSNTWSSPSKHFYAPLATIFDRDFPEAGEFKTYGSKSKFWNDTVTTKKNDWYDVKEGWTVKVALIIPNMDLSTIPLRPKISDFESYANATDKHAEVVTDVLSEFFGNP